VYSPVVFVFCNALDDFTEVTVQIRSISQNELQRFAEVSFPPNDTETGKQVVLNLWESGESRPDWCFIAEDGDKWLGGVFYRSRWSGVSFYDLQVAEDSDYFIIGAQLLNDSLRQLYQQGVRRFHRHFHLGENHVDKWRSLLDYMKIPLEQEKSQFTWSSEQSLPTANQRLNFRNLDEVGESTVVDVVRRVSEGTLDRVDQLALARTDPRTHAQEYFNILKNGYLSQPRWWELAYNNDDQLVGLHLPVHFKDVTDEGTIGYIGIVPEQRGQGYIHDVLARCTETLIKMGIATIVTDTDSLNVPMANAFKKYGYQSAGTVWVYAADLEVLFT
jgi:RimJ/RimL family protein N-acetyltransferase